MHGALALPMPQAWESMARLARQAPVALFTPAPLAPPAGWTIIRHFDLFEMVHEDGAPVIDRDASITVTDLSEADLPEMTVLYAATRPNRKLCQRIQKLGGFLGIRSDQKLVAMAGLRMHLPGYREITTVATLPGYEGRGYATALAAALVERIRERNERPFLTVRSDNARAVEIYRRLGFRERARLHSTAVVWESR